MPAYVIQYGPGHYYEGKHAIKVKVYKKGWHRCGKYDYKTYIGEYDTWKDAVRDMRRRRQELEKETRSETRAPTATVPPRSTSKRKQIDRDEVIRAEYIAEAQRLALVQEPDVHADSDDGFVAPPADDDDDEDTPWEPGLSQRLRPRQPANNHSEPQVYEDPPTAERTSLRGDALLPYLEKYTTHGLNRNIVHFAYALFFGKNIENEIKEETARKFENTVQSVRVTPQGGVEIKDVMEACRGAREVGEEKLQEAVSKIEHLAGKICVLYVFGSARKSSNLKDDTWAYKGKGWVVPIRVEIKLSRRVSNTAES